MEIHSLRKQKNPPKYLLNGEPKPIVNYRHGEPIEWRNRIKNIHADYLKENKQTIRKTTKLYQEACIVFSVDQFEKCKVEDIENYIKSFCDKFEKEHKCKILYSSLHLDEGREEKDENGEKTGKVIKNPHAHFMIENYNFEKHKTTLQNLDYRKLQTEIATHFSELGFIRGDPDKHAVRLEQEEWREVAQEKEATQIAHKKELLDVDNAFISVGQRARKAIEEHQKNLIMEMAAAFGDDSLDSADKVKEKAKELREKAKIFNADFADHEDFLRFKLNRKNFHEELERLSKQKTAQISELEKSQKILDHQDKTMEAQEATIKSYQSTIENLDEQIMAKRAEVAQIELKPQQQQIKFDVLKAIIDYDIKKFEERHRQNAKDWTDKIKNHYEIATNTTNLNNDMGEYFTFCENFSEKQENIFTKVKTLCKTLLNKILIELDIKQIDNVQDINDSKKI